MIFYDVTKSAKAKHASGLMRVNRRLSDELGKTITPVVWGKWDPAMAQPTDWYLTTETFDLATRPGFEDFLKQPTCRTAALFADAIPLKHPQITWPHSVSRHPRYMHALSLCEHVFAISEAVRQDLVSFWHWQGNDTKTQVSVLPLGADFDGGARHPRRECIPGRSLVCVGIIEPRKNQDFLLTVAELLWAAGEEFELHLVGRVNPHYGTPIVKRIRQLQRHRPQLHFHEAADDATFARLLDEARAVVFPTIAEGCGLPVLEALWRALPCVCSDLPVLLENTGDGGCLPLGVNDVGAWTEGLRRLLSDDAYWRQLADVAAERPLPTWSDSAQEILRVCR